MEKAYIVYINSLLCNLYEIFSSFFREIVSLREQNRLMKEKLAERERCEQGRG